MMEICHSNKLGKEEKMKNSFVQIFNKQVSYQEKVLEKRHEKLKVPGDSLKWFSYHIQAMVEELGEVMKADKRWKTHRNERYVMEEKKDEIADVFITAMNIAMYSGFTANEIEEAIENKINENEKKLGV